MGDINSESYFAPLLPWQSLAWTQVTAQYHAHKLPHGLLAAGMAGIGKRAFVERFVAWLLCADKPAHGACGICQSCLWLKAGTHPDLKRLPSDGDVVKIDEIRALQEFFVTKSAGARVVVLDNADKMTLGAANAFLKSLEEPSDGLFFVLISDNPSRLLPTIKSRVQALPLSVMDTAVEFVATHCPDEMKGQAEMLLELADFAPLKAVELPSLAWFTHRTTWLKTFVALQVGQRTPIQASDYWQGVLPLAEFLALSRLMLSEIWRVAMGLEGLHKDIDVLGFVEKLCQVDDFGERKLSQILTLIHDTEQALSQNIQEKMAYDGLMVGLAN